MGGAAFSADPEEGGALDSPSPDRDSRVGLFAAARRGELALMTSPVESGEISDPVLDVFLTALGFFVGAIASGSIFRVLLVAVPTGLFAFGESTVEFSCFSVAEEGGVFESDSLIEKWLPCPGRQYV